MKLKHADLQVNGLTFFMPGTSVMKVENSEVTPEVYVVINFSVDDSMFNNTLTTDRFKRDYLDGYSGETRIQLIKKSALDANPLGSNPEDKCVVSVKNLIYVEADFIELERYRLINFVMGDHELTSNEIKAQIMKSTNRKGSLETYLSTTGLEMKEWLLSNKVVLSDYECIDLEKANKFIGFIKARI